MDNLILNAALEYASKGWSVIPISRDKKPLIQWKTATREQLTNPDNIKKWWSQYPAANVAIVTGKRSGGLVVIDLDVDDEKGIDGKDSLKEWCDQNYIYDIESCATVATGRGGQHLYFQSDYTYHNQVGCLVGVDIRAEGGCVVAPPSIHGSTKKAYTWDIEEDDVNVPKADSDVVFFLASMEEKSGSKTTGKKNDFTEITEEGGRNNKLFKYVSRLQGDGESDEHIREWAIEYNKHHLKPPLGDDEVQRTIESVLSHTDWKGTSKKQPEEQKPKQNSKKTFRKLKTAEELMKKDLPEPKVFIGVGDELPLLTEGTCILSAKPKIGKSWFALGMCLAISKGEDFIGYKTNKCSTLYLDLETSEQLQQKRMRKALAGSPVPNNFYLDTETDTLENGFVDQIEYYLQEDPDIGVVVIDVFQIIRTAAKSIKETEYEHSYRDITPLNELANKHHIAIILVCHDRKAVDQDDPFSNILGSIGIQGAATQMMVMFKRRKDDPIHISVKSKTIDGLPELNVKIENGRWMLVNGVNSAEREAAELITEFNTSAIREAVVEIANNNTFWKGRCSTLINDAIEYGVGITETPKLIGGFLHRHQGRFLKECGVKISIINNGTGSKVYEIEKSTIDTIDENTGSPLMEFENADNYRGSEIPFL